MALSNVDVRTVRIAVLRDLVGVFDRIRHPEVHSALGHLLRNLEADEMEEQGHKEQADTYRRVVPEF